MAEREVLKKCDKTSPPSAEQLGSVKELPPEKDSKNISRRGLLLSTAKVGATAASTVVIGYLSGLPTIFSRIRGGVKVEKRLRNLFDDAVKSQEGAPVSEEVQRLEAFALKTQEGFEFETTEKRSNSLYAYEMYFQASLHPYFRYAWFLAHLKSKFPNDGKLVVADIGGSAGTAAKQLQIIPWVEAFNIDPLLTNVNPDHKGFLPPDGKWLPRDRYIIRCIEKTGLPDNSFHFMTSFDTYQYTKPPASITEVHRLLKPGGVAIIECTDWPDYFGKILDVPLKDEVHLALNIKGPKLFSLRELQDERALKKALKTLKSDEDMMSSIDSLAHAAVVVEKGEKNFKSYTEIFKPLE